MVITILATISTLVGPFLWYHLGKSRGFEKGYNEAMQDNGYVWDNKIGKLGAWVRYTSSLYDRV